MYVKLLSDIHLEYFDLYPGLSHFIDPSQPIDIICLCGDIGDPTFPEYRRFLQECAECCRVMTFVVMGNHEAYYKSVLETERIITDICKSHDKLTFLHRNAIDIGNDYRFIGTTLWSDIDVKQTPLMRQRVTDFRMIAGLTVSDYHSRFRKDVKWICDELERANRDNKKLIVLTHHVPVLDANHPKHDQSVITSAFASDLKNLIEENNDRIAFWFHGHNHFSRMIRIGNTWIMSNQYGRHKEDTGFEEGWILRL